MVHATAVEGLKDGRLRVGMIGGGRKAFIGAVHRMAMRLDDLIELKAGALSSDAENARASGADLGLAKAVLLGREKKDAEAVEALSACETEEGKLTAIALLERGRLYDKMNRFEEAWVDSVEGKRLCREVQGRNYDAAAVDPARSDR